MNSFRKEISSSYNDLIELWNQHIHHWRLDENNTCNKQCHVQSDFTNWCAEKSWFCSWLVLWHRKSVHCVLWLVSTSRLVWLSSKSISFSLWREKKKRLKRIVDKRVAKKISSLPIFPNPFLRFLTHTISHPYAFSMKFALFSFYTFSTGKDKRISKARNRKRKKMNKTK